MSDDDSDDSSDDEFDFISGNPPEVQAITAVVDMLDGLGEDNAESWWVWVVGVVRVCGCG